MLTSSTLFFLYNTGVIVLLILSTLWTLVAAYRQLRLGRLVNNAHSPLALDLPFLVGLSYLGLTLLLLWFQSVYFYLAVPIGLSLIATLNSRSPNEQFGWTQLSLTRWLSLSFLLAATAMVIVLPISGLVSYIAETIFHRPLPEELAVQVFREALNDPFRLGLILFQVVLLAPFMEELFFRGLLYTFCKKYVPVWAALLISGLFFALAHEDIGAFLPLWIFGLILALAYEQTGSLLLSMGVHSLFNLATALQLLLGGDATP